MPGMRTSSSRQQGCLGGYSRSIASKASALSKAWLGRWRERNNQARPSRTLASSSTMKTMASWLGCMARS